MRAGTCEPAKSVLSAGTGESETEIKSINELVDCFAATLAHLHNLKVAELGIDVLRPPEDGYAFARRWPIYFRHYLNLETKHEKRLKKDFNLAIRWLNSNVSNNFCPQYCLVHGDHCNSVGDHVVFARSDGSLW